jgi:hypothetical protein
LTFRASEPLDACSAKHHEIFHQSTIQTALDASWNEYVLSPALVQTSRGKNVLANGSFDKLDKAGKSTGWSGFSPNAKVVKETKAGGVMNHYVVVAPNDKHYAPYVTSRLLLKPQWKALRISARMKSQDGCARVAGTAIISEF